MGYLKAVDIEAQHIMTVKQTLPLTGDYVYYSKFQFVPWLLQLKAQKKTCATEPTFTEQKNKPSKCRSASQCQPQTIYAKGQGLWYS